MEAKPEGTSLSGVERQSAMYATGLPERHRRRATVHEGRLPFVFEASGSETHLTNGYDPVPRARRFPGFPQPRMLARWLRDAQADPAHPTWRARVADLPPVPGAPEGMRAAQTTAIAGVERSLREGRHDRSLVQMATSAGKTYTAVSECYRLVKHGGMRRILFLVDRTNLGEQALGEFASFVTQTTAASSPSSFATEITEYGSTVEAGSIVPVMDRRTRQQRYEAIEDDLAYTGRQLDRAVSSPAQVRLVLETFRDRLPTEIFPGRTEVPKTLIFCKDDAHAEQVVTLAREVFGRGNDFAVKITCNASWPRELIKAFRTSPTMRIAVTVDMIATGTDIKPLECVLFLRDVRSATYFEQMKGRGARTIDANDFQAVTPDALAKDRFVIVDAVGVTEHDFVDATPLARDRSASLEQLLQKAATLTITEDEVATLASRLARLDQQLDDGERAELAGLAGQALRSLTRGLVEAVDPDRQAAAMAASPDSSREDVVESLIETAIEPLAGNAALRRRIVEIRRTHDLVIDDLSTDRLLRAGGVVDPSRARSVVDSWAQYVRDNTDEITALQVLYEATPHGRVDYSSLRELADRIKRPPYGWTPDLLWTAYESLEVGRVRHSDRHTVTDLIRLVRFALGREDELVPYASVVAERYEAWLLQQEQAGAVFSADQRWWLDRIADTVAESAGVTADDLEKAPFTGRGGVDGAVREFGPGVADILASMNEELTA